MGRMSRQVAVRLRIPPACGLCGLCFLVGMYTSPNRTGVQLAAVVTIQIRAVCCNWMSVTGDYACLLFTCGKYK